MDISREIALLKEDPGFARGVGMVLAHNGTVRALSRDGGFEVSHLDVRVDEARLEELRLECERRPGIHRVLVEARSGRLEPGEDLLLVVVAGDIRENVRPALDGLVDRIKAEAVTKTEFAG